MVSAVSMVNVAMVGSLGPAATAAVAVNSAPMWLLNSFPLGLSVGGTVLVARNVGAGDRLGANDAASQTLGAGVIFSSLIFLIMLFLSGQVPAILNTDPEIRQIAGTYLQIVSLSIIFHFSGLVCAGILRGSGNTKTPMFIALLTNVLNICSNFFLIFPTRTISLAGQTFTLPGAGLGVIGASISTACAQTLSGIILILIVCGKNQPVRVNIKRIFKIKKDTLLAILKIGVPAVGERVTINLGQVFYQKIVNALGTAATAAHYVATTAESISYMPANAFSTAATTLVGQSLGAKDKEKARKFAKTNIYCGVAIGIFCMFVLFLLPKYLVRIFSPDAEVIELGVSVLRVIAPVEPFFCLLIVITGVLRGGGDTKFAFIAGLCGMWGIRLATSHIATNIFGLGLVGAWLGMGADIMVRAAIMYFRYRRKRWLETD